MSKIRLWNVDADHGTSGEMVRIIDSDRRNWDRNTYQSLTALAELLYMTGRKSAAKLIRYYNGILVSQLPRADPHTYRFITSWIHKP